MEKRNILILAIYFIILALVFLIIFNFYNQKEEILTCGDDTPYGECSLIKPYFCLEGFLVEKASVCGCPDILTQKGDLCISKYQTDSKNITLKYVLRGEEKEIDFVVYKGLVDYISELPKSIYYPEGEEPSRQDFVLRNINEEEQRELLLPLLIKIQNATKDKNDQVRIAISLVQEIPFGSSGKMVALRSQQINYSRYPYEVLYDMQGICGEKSELLAFLLREMGYNIVLFYHKLENHESLGIKCPVEHSLEGTGYCFVETSGPSIITNYQLKYVGGITLSSEPELILISDGDSLARDLYEYKDAKSLIKINNNTEEKGKLDLIKTYKLEKLNKKYRLIESYNA